MHMHIYSLFIKYVLPKLLQYSESIAYKEGILTLFGEYFCTNTRVCTDAVQRFNLTTVTQKV